VVQPKARQTASHQIALLWTAAARVVIRSSRIGD